MQGSKTITEGSNMAHSLYFISKALLDHICSSVVHVYFRVVAAELQISHCLAYQNETVCSLALYRQMFTNPWYRMCMGGR